MKQNFETPVSILTGKGITLNSVIFDPNRLNLADLLRWAGVPSFIDPAILDSADYLHAVHMIKFINRYGELVICKESGFEVFNSNLDRIFSSEHKLENRSEDAWNYIYFDHYEYSEWHADGMPLSILERWQ